MYTLNDHFNVGAIVKASFLDLRKRSREILRALEQRQRVTLVYRGRTKGVIVPAAAKAAEAIPVSRHPAFGMWRARPGTRDVRRFVDRLRKARHAL